MISQLLIRTLPLVPTPIMRRLASRYIAGETLEEALTKTKSLVERGFTGILDILGEEITSETHARQVAADYKAAASALVEHDLDSYVSVKPTHVGLTSSEELCYELYAEIAEHCASIGKFLRVEMEDHRTTDGTLRVFERLREKFDNVGIVLQSRLFRTPEDIEKLAPGPLNVRMVKGIYLEPTEIAHSEPDPIREAFMKCTELLIARGATLSLATHDDALADRLIALLSEHSYKKEQYEFQVLLGVRESLWRRWKDAGHPVRVYVPYGPDWRAYSLRRLQRNPEIFQHVLRNMFSGD